MGNKQDRKARADVRAIVERLEHDPQSLLLIVELAESMAKRSRARRRRT